MYSTGLDIDKASTIGPEISSTPSIIFTGGKMCKIWHRFQHHSSLSRTRFKMQQGILTVKPKCNAEIITVCPHQVWWSWVHTFSTIFSRPRPLISCLRPRHSRPIPRFYQTLHSSALYVFQGYHDDDQFNSCTYSLTNRANITKVLSIIRISLIAIINNQIGLVLFDCLIIVW